MASLIQLPTKFSPICLFVACSIAVSVSLVYLLEYALTKEAMLEELRVSSI